MLDLERVRKLAETIFIQLSTDRTDQRSFGDSPEYKSGDYSDAAVKDWVKRINEGDAALAIQKAMAFESTFANFQLLILEKTDGKA